MKLLPFLIADGVDLDPVIEDVEADITPDGVNILRTTETYHRVVGYLCECKVSGIQMLGTKSYRDVDHNSQQLPYDPVCLGPGEIDVLAEIIRAWERKKALEAKANDAA
jgi:hypothetical protein